jgi:glucokinase
MKLIAGDIGGTKTILALYTTENGPGMPLREDTYPSGAYDSLEAVVREFITRYDIKGVDHAVFGVAGPVVETHARITNLPWEIDAGHLQKEFGLRKVQLINDLQAVAYSISQLGDEDLFTINQGTVNRTGPKAVIAAGTGLGEAYLTWDGLHYIAHASEGGHTEFGPSNALELELLKRLMDRFDHVSYERICSGTGIPNIYSFLKDRGIHGEPAWFEEKLHKASDKTALIVNAGLDGEEPCEICRETLRMFLSILGAEAGNLALKILASGGVYVGGGIPPRLVSVIRESPFMDSFLRKGRLSGIIAAFPVHIILNPKAGLLGAAFFGLEIMDTLP